jgi:hypothetical protein
VCAGAKRRTEAKEAAAFHRYEVIDGHTQDAALTAEQDEAERCCRLPGSLASEAEPCRRQGRVVMNGRSARPQAEADGLADLKRLRVAEEME